MTAFAKRVPQHKEGAKSNFAPTFVFEKIFEKVIRCLMRVSYSHVRNAINDSPQTWFASTIKNVKKCVIVAKCYLILTDIKSDVLDCIHFK